jgi:hypothetical protein
MIVNIFIVNVPFSYAQNYENNVVDDLINNKGYTYFTEKFDIPLDKKFKIVLSKNVNYSSLKDNLRILKGNSDIEHEITYKLLEPNIIEITPVSNFEVQGVYYLIIDDGLKTTYDNKPLMNGGVLKFNVVNEISGFNIENVNFKDDRILNIIFNEDVDYNSVMNLINYEINGVNLSKTNSKIAMIDSNKVQITLEDALAKLELQDVTFRASGDIKNKDGLKMEHSYFKRLKVNLKDKGFAHILMSGNMNYDRLEVDANINVLAGHGIIRNTNINGDLYVTGSYTEFENVKVNGTVFIDVGIFGYVDLKNVEATKIKVLSGRYDSGVDFYGVRVDELEVKSNTNVGIRIYDSLEGYPTNIYRTNVTLKTDRIKLSNKSLDNDISFGRIEITKDSVEDKTIELEGNVIKQKEYLELNKGVTVRAINGATLVQNIVARQDNKGTIKLTGSGPTDSNFGEITVEEQGSLELSTTTISKVIMKADYVNLDLDIGEIGMLVTNNNDVLMDNATKQNIGNIVIKDPDDPEDITPPEVKAEAQTVYNTVNNDNFPTIAKVQSNELSGHVYIVKTGELQDTYKEIEELREKDKAARSVVTSMNEDIEISALGLEPGTYYAYAIDGAKNMSTRGENEIEVIGLEKTTKITLNNPPREGDVTITGVAEPDAIVNMVAGTNQPIQTTAGSDGAFAFAGISIVKGQTLAFTAKHPSKLTSDALTVTVLDSLKQGNNINEFKFLAQGNQNISTIFGDVVGQINEGVNPPEITMNIPSGTSTSNFVASFTLDTGALAMINGVQMSSGVSPYVNYQGVSIDVKAENGQIKQYRIILNELNGETDVTATADYIIDQNIKTIAGGTNDRIDTNLTANEFNSNMIYPTDSKYVIVESITDEANFDKNDFDVIYADSTKQINGTEQLKMNSKLIIKAEDGTIKIYSLIVTGPKLIVNDTTKNIKQQGTSLNDGVHQVDYYKVQLSNSKKGTVKVSTDVGNIEVTFDDLTPTAILNKLKADLDANKATLGLDNFTIDVVNGELKVAHTVGNPEANRANLLTITEITESNLYKNIDITKNAGRKERSEYLLNYELGAGSSNAKVEIKDALGRSVASYTHTSTEPMDKVELASNIQLVDTQSWDLGVSSNVLTFNSKAYDENRDLTMTVTNAVYATDANSFKRITNIEGQKYKYTMDFEGFDKPMTYSFDLVEYKNDINNPYETTVNSYEIYVATPNDAVSEIKEIFDNSGILWDTAGTAGAQLVVTGKRGVLEIGTDVVRVGRKEDVNITLAKQSKSIEGEAYTESKPIIATVDFDLTNPDSTNELTIQIDARNVEDNKDYTTTASVNVSEAGTKTKADIINKFAQADYTGKDFEVITREELKALVGEDSNVYKTTTLEQIIIVKQNPQDNINDLTVDITSAK